MSKRLIKVGAGGVLSTLVDVCSLIALVEIGGMHVTIAAFLGAMFGGVTGFGVNKFWAFKDRTPIRLKQVSTYMFVSLMTAVFVAGTIHVLAINMAVPYLIAKGVAAVLVFLCWGYPAQVRLVFPGAARRVA